MTMTRQRLAVIATVLFSVVAVGCGDDDDGGTPGADAGTRDAQVGGDGGGGSDGGGGGTDAGDEDDAGGGGTDAGGEEISFSDVYSMAIMGRCTGCHSGAAPAGMLNMSTEAMAYDNLVGVDAMGGGVNGCGMTDWVRVVPGNAEESLLYEKVSEAMPDCGNHMPPGGDLPDELKELIFDWIEAGAVE